MHYINHSDIRRIGSRANLSRIIFRREALGERNEHIKAKSSKAQPEKDLKGNINKAKVYGHDLVKGAWDYLDKTGRDLYKRGELAIVTPQDRKEMKEDLGTIRQDMVALTNNIRRLVYDAAQLFNIDKEVPAFFSGRPQQARRQLRRAERKGKINEFKMKHLLALLDLYSRAEELSEKINNPFDEDDAEIKRMFTVDHLWVKWLKLERDIYALQESVELSVEEDEEEVEEYEEEDGDNEAEINIQKNDSPENLIVNKKLKKVTREDLSEMKDDLATMREDIVSLTNRVKRLVFDAAQLFDVDEHVPDLFTGRSVFAQRQLRKAEKSGLINPFKKARLLALMNAYHRASDLSKGLEKPFRKSASNIKKIYAVDELWLKWVQLDKDVIDLQEEVELPAEKKGPIPNHRLA